MAKERNRARIKIERVRTKFKERIEKLSLEKIRLEKELKEMETYYLTKIRFYQNNTPDNAILELAHQNKLLKNENYVLMHKLVYFTGKNVREV